MSIFKRLAVLLSIAACCLALGTSFARAQAEETLNVQRDIAYDNADPAQKLDVYLADSDKPTPVMVFIHGGGWRAGSKAHVPHWLIGGVKAGRLSVVSVEYRFTNVAPHPAQVSDCMRAIQFVRHNAEKWNIDPKRIGVTGGSAGGHLSLWVGVHDDIADARAEDPVRRQSSRVACVVDFAGPADWSLLSQLEHNHPAYRQLLGYEPGTPADKMDAAAMKDVSPISFVSEDDPPVLLVHGDKDDIVPPEHAIRMHKRLKAAGVTTELVLVEGANHGVAGAGPQVTQRAITFTQEHLGLRKRAD